MLPNFRKWLRPQKSGGIRALAFTCSRHRPLMLRHCIMQLQRQSYPIDHAIYVNSPDEEFRDRTSIHYQKLLNDVRNNTSGKVWIKYGNSKTNQDNYATALKMRNIDDYDLFLKIDDDDIYLQSYVEGVVDDFADKRWDFSGSYSHGVLNGHRWFPKKIQKDLGLGPEDIDLKIPGFMPSSAAFSRKAVRVVLDAPSSDFMEDIHWRRTLALTPNLVMAVRNDRNFIYNIHGANLSTAHWLTA